MKKLAVFLISLICAITCAIGFTACAGDDEVDAPALSFREYNGNVYIEKVNNTDKIKGTESNPYTLPSTYEGKPVVGIDKQVFKNCYQLYAIYVPSNITSIGFEALDNPILKLIIYEGTMQEWRSIKTQAPYATNSDKTIRCSNGTLDANNKEITE